MEMKKTIFFTLLLSLSIPLALAFANITTGLVSPQVFFENLNWSSLGFLLLSSVSMGVVLRIALSRLFGKSEIWLLKVIRFSFMIWGPLHNIVFSYLYHSNSSFGTDLPTIILTSMYAGAVGLFFSILLVVGTSDELEQAIPQENHRKGKIAGGLTSKLFFSVTLVVAAFLTGAIGVSLLPIIAGFTIIEALPRIIIIAAPFLVLTVVLVYFLSKIMTKPLVNSMPLIEALGKNDLTQRLTIVGRDEISRLFLTLNDFIGQLKMVLTEAAHNSRLNTDYSRDLDELVEKQQGLLENIHREIEHITKVIETVGLDTLATVEASETMEKTARDLQDQIFTQTSSIEQTSGAAQELHQKADTINQITESRKEVAKTMLLVTKENRDTLQISIKAMDLVTTQIKSLADLNKVISDVSERTNLLAMNAAIEAAHAGALGSGFSVVAQEIRKLAESTSISARDSSSFLQKMVEGIQESGASLHALNQSFVQVEESSVGVVSGLEEINHAARLIQESSQSISQRMKELQSISLVVRRDAQEIAEKARGVNKISRDSNDSSRLAKEQGARAEVKLLDLVQTTKEITALSTTINDNAGTLTRRFDSFRLDIPEGV